MMDLTGHILQGYELKERLGTGGFGAVYKAVQSTVGREVAVKVILPGYANQPDFIRRFESEAQLIARLEHLHIVPLYDYWRDPNGAYLVMRWMRGGSLRDLLVKEGSCSLERTGQILNQITSALSLAHRNNIIHRDLKPGNILLDEDGNAYLADFGIAKDISLPGVTEPEAIVGSPDYLSPEQARSEAVTPSTDVYSLGVVLYEMLTGQHPFPDVSTVERLFKHINDPLPVIENLDSTIIDAVNEVIQKATAKDPRSRYSDVLTFASAFFEAAALNQASPTGSIVETLTRKEQEILHYIIEGRTNKEIADRLFVTVATVKWYITQIYRKLGVRSRMQASVRARELNLIVHSNMSAGHDASSPENILIPTDEFQPDNPYKGLHAFESADYRDFFGRERLVAKVVQRLSETDDSSRFLAIIGPSGSGKSSLVKAGVIPAIWRGEVNHSEKWFVVEMVPGSRPLDELEVALTRIASRQTGNLNEQLRRDEFGLLRATNMVLPEDGSELLIVVDQFEEVFTLIQDESVRTHFLKLIHAAVTERRSRVRVVITLRADFYDRPLQYPDFGNLVRNRMETVLPLGAKELEGAIVQPASRTGMSFEDGLVGTIIDDIHYQPGALPLLQYALTELFERREGRVLTARAYEAMGRATGALANRAEALYLEYDTRSQDHIRQIFLRLVTLDDGMEDARRRTPRAELLNLSVDADVIEEIIDTFAEYRLLSMDHDTGSRRSTVEVAHEALLREWGRLRSWISESRDEIKLQRQLAVMAHDWYAANKESSFLMRGTRLDQFEAWAQDTEMQLTPQERAFLDASLRSHERENQAELLRQAREQRLERRSQMFLRSLVVVFALAAMIAVGLSQVAFRERDRANENALYASSIALAAAADSASANDSSDQAIALALTANRISDAPPAFAQRILYNIATDSGVTRQLFASEPAVWARLSPDGNYILSWNQPPFGDEMLFVYREIASGQVLGKWSPAFLSLDETENVLAFQGLVFAHNGRSAFVAGNSAGAQIIEFDVVTGEEIRRLDLDDIGIPLTIYTLALSPDGQTLLAGTGFIASENALSVSGQIYGWNLNTGERVETLWTGLEMSSGVSALSFSPNGGRVFVGYLSGEVELWDVSTRERVGENGKTGGRIHAAYFTSAGIVIVSTSEADQTELTLWSEDMQAAEYQTTFPLDYHGSALSPDGQILALALYSPQITLFDIQAWQVVDELYGHGTDVFSVDFIPDNQMLLSGSSDTTLRLWNLVDMVQTDRIHDLVGVVSGMEVGPDGQTLLVQAYNGPLTLWDLNTNTLIRTLGQTENGIRNIAFSPDSRFVAYGSSSLDAHIGGCPGPGSDLYVIDVTNGEIVWQSRNENGYMNPGIAFSHDGKYILTTDWWCESTITIWDATTGDRIADWEGHQGPVFAVRTSPDGRYVATGSRDMTAIIWNASDGTILHVLHHTGLVGNLAFNSDGSQLATSSEEGLLQIWDTTTGERILQLAGHTSLATSLHFSPDDRYLVSSGREMLINVWDLELGEIVRQFQLASQSRFGSVVTFSPERGSILITEVNSAIGSSTVRQIDLLLDPEDLFSWINTNRYVRDITCDERDLYRIEPFCEA